MPKYVRVTDDVKPRREYSIVESTYDSKVHTLLEDKPAAKRDGTPLPPKYTPPELVSASGQVVGWAAKSVKDLRVEIDVRNDARPEAQAISKAGKKADLVERLDADDDAQIGQDEPNPEAIVADVDPGDDA